MPINSPIPAQFRAIWPAALLLVAALLFGGASRIEVIGSAVVLLVAVLVFTIIVFRQSRDPVRVDRFALLLFIAMAGWMLVQLIPLPYGLWSAMPGRETAVAVYQSIGDTPWGTISLTPARTASAFFALVAPFVAFFAVSALDHKQRRTIAKLIVALAVASALLGLLQLAGGEASSLRLYRITDTGSAVGLFSNPNHQGTLLAIATLFLFVTLGDAVPVRGRFPGGTAFGVVALVALFAIAALFTRSRAALLFMTFAFVVGMLLLPYDRMAFLKGRLRWWKPAAGVAAVATIGVIWAALQSPAARSFFEVDQEESRLTKLPEFARVAADFFPFGSGFGSFDPVFRSYETLAVLNRNYWNQAHNEPIQLLMEGGLVAAALMVGLLIWFARRSIAAWAGGLPTDEDSRLRRAASAAVAIALLHSLVDYPLRTAALAVVVAVCAAMMTTAPGAGRRRSERSARP